MLLALALVVAVQDQVAANEKLAKMAALFDEVCLRAFPDDRAVDDLMIQKQARPLAPSEVKVTFQDDPGRAWELADRSASVWLELPPFHACSVRWNSPAMPEPGAYRMLADSYEQRTGGFVAIGPYDDDRGAIHVHAVGEQRRLNDGGGEALFFVDQHIADPARRAAGETGFSLRFVHQFSPPQAH